MNPCLKTGITVATDDGQFIHGDLFLNEFGIQVRGAGPLMASTGRPGEAVVTVKEVRQRDGWIDYTVDLISITPALAEFLKTWSADALEFFLESGVELAA